ncbi:MAG: histidine phosphatase family protein [Cellulomonas sp.]
MRHGQTEFNFEHRLQGWCDSPLTLAGRDGVRATAGRLADRPFTRAYVSTSGRAQDTAREILAQHPCSPPTVVDPDLREFAFGEFEARAESALYARHDPDMMFPAVLHGTFAGLPGGESGLEFVTRVHAAFARIERAHPDGHVLVVSHGLALRAYLTMIDPRPIAPLPNASISTVEVHPDGTRRVIALGVDPTSALRPAPVAVDVLAR